MMVRLEVLRFLAHLFKNCAFQFHDGAIGRHGKAICMDQFHLFQFHDGAIGRQHHYSPTLLSDAFQFHDGAIGRWGNISLISMESFISIP